MSSYFATLAHVRKALRDKPAPLGMELMGIPATEFTKGELLKLMADLALENATLKQQLAGNNGDGNPPQPEKPRIVLP